MPRRAFWPGASKGANSQPAESGAQGGAAVPGFRYAPSPLRGTGRNTGSHFCSEPLNESRMPNPDLAIPSRAPAEVSADDTILPFEVAPLDLRGRVVRLGPTVDTILTGHDYPEPVAKLLGEAIVLGTLLGSALKFDGRFILQTKTDGPVRMLVVDFMTPDKVRACARFDKDRVADAIASGARDAGALLGRGHLAMTIDQGGEMSRYQGLVALEGGTLEDAAHEYFLRSEQIPTRVRLAVAEEFLAARSGARHRWRAGGLLLQFVPRAPVRARGADLQPGGAPG